MHLIYLPTMIVGEKCIAIRNQYGIGIDFQACSWPMMLARDDPDPNPMGTFIVALLTKIMNSVVIATTADGIRPTLKSYVSNPKPLKYRHVLTLNFQGNPLWFSGFSDD
jgi:hypothetical protein